MPDMSQPGAHLTELLDTYQFKQADHYDLARKHTTIAEIYQECAFTLRAALEKEAAKELVRPEHE